MTTTIPAFTSLPLRTTSPETFEADWVQFLQETPGFVTAANALAAELNANLVTLAGSVATALAGGAAFKGNWSALGTSAVAVPASVYHNGAFWMARNAIANASLAVPGVSTSWARLSPPQSLPIMHGGSANVEALSSGEVITNAVTPLTLTTATDVVSDFSGGAYVAFGGAGVSTVMRANAAGAAWQVANLPSAGTWAVLGLPNGFIAFKEGTTSYATSADGITWTGATAAVTFGTSLKLKAASVPILSSILVHDSTPAIRVSHDNGATWTAAQTIPATFTVCYAVPTSPNNDLMFVGKTATTAYWTSATGLTGSWTSRTLPAPCDTLIQDVNFELLAYKAGSVVDDVYKSVDGGLTWESLGFKLLRSSSLRRPVLGNADIPMHGATNDTGGFWTRHAGRWVARTSTFALSSAKHVAGANGSVVVAIDGGAAHTIDINDSATIAKGIFAF